ncbi:hypothetical protein EXIGLDRAFT_836000 [Exidia glandulosa HHB12029]|uniref:F-box domain-containing protein n=1 Tax=Exidia glandulosa HHB12029 TaxID=1314781 RepID=A0A165I760_EXIGL|nr:hypothetical protein EXIGLDRAFT_836000 [Exidia glandulosa HHB12029]
MESPTIRRLVALTKLVTSIQDNARLASAEDANVEAARINSIILSRRQSLHRRLNHQCSLLLSLPSNVLCRILEHSALRDRNIISATCHRLRSVAFMSCHLWTQLRTSGSALPSLAHLLQRSQPYPVHLTLQLDARLQIDDMNGVLVSLLPRLEYLSIQVYALDNGTMSAANIAATRAAMADVWRSLVRALASAAPLRMRAFHISVVADPPMDPSLRLRDDLFGGHTGALHELSIDGLPSPAASFSPLQNLTFDHVTTFNHTTMADTVDNQFMDRLWAILPRLETLGLRAMWPLLQGTSRHIPSSLKQVALVIASAGVRSGESFKDVCDYFPGIEDLVVTTRAPPTFDAYGNFHLIVSLHLIAVHFDSPRVTQCTRLPMIDMRVALASANLVSVTIHEALLPEEVPLDTTTCFLQLCIIMDPCCDSRLPWWAGDDTGIFIHTGRLLHCPRLRRLHLTFDSPRCEYYSAGVGSCPCRRIAVSDITSFIVQRLGYGGQAQRIPRLDLSGVRDLVDYDLSRALDSLRGVVEVVQLTSGIEQDFQRYIVGHSNYTEPAAIFKKTGIADDQWAVLDHDDRY